MINFDDLDRMGSKINLQQKIYKRIIDGENPDKAFKNVLLEHVMNKVLITDCNDDLVDDMGFLLDKYDEYSCEDQKSKNKFYEDLLINMALIFNSVNSHGTHIEKVLAYGDLKTMNIKKEKNTILFIHGQDKKEAVIYLFNYIDREFVKNTEKGNVRQKK